MVTDPADAQDLAQETFIRFMAQRAENFANQRAMLAWLYRTSSRLAVDKYRKGKRERLASPEEISTLRRQDCEPSRAEARDVLRKVARRIPKNELHMAILHRIDGMTQEEVAEVTGRSARHVRRVLKNFDSRIDKLGLEK